MAFTEKEREALVAGLTQQQSEIKKTGVLTTEHMREIVFLEDLKAKVAREPAPRTKADTL